MTTAYRPAIETAAAAHEIDPRIVEALVLVESSGDPWAFRYEQSFYLRYIKGQTTPAAAPFLTLGPLAACSYGLCQTLFVVAYEVGFRGTPEQLFVPELSLDAGCAKLRQLLIWSKGNVAQALSAYNGGKKANSVPPYRNQAYANKVMKQLANLPSVGI